MNVHHLLYQYLQCVTSSEATVHVINPLSPHVALKHHFTSLETDLIFLQPKVSE